MIAVSPEIIIIIAIVSIIVGVLANIAGFGGAILLIPLLRLFGFDLHVIIGSALSAIAIPALIGFLKSWKRGEVDVIAGIALEIPTMVGVVIGAFVSGSIDERTITMIFAVLVFIVAIRMVPQIFRKGELNTEPSDFWKRVSSIRPFIVIERENYSYRLSLPLMVVAGLIIGFLSGLLGVGGGWLKTPMLIYGIGLPPIIASGTALFMLIFTAISGGTVHYLSGNWDPLLFGILTVSLTAGALIGDRYKSRFKGSLITTTITVSLLLISIVMFTEGLLA